MNSTASKRGFCFLFHFSTKRTTILVSKRIGYFENFTFSFFFYYLLTMKLVKDCGSFYRSFHMYKPPLSAVASFLLFFFFSPALASCVALHCQQPFPSYKRRKIDAQ